MLPIEHCKAGSTDGADEAKDQGHLADGKGLRGVQPVDARDSGQLTDEPAAGEEVIEVVEEALDDEDVDDLKMMCKPLDLHLIQIFYY